jgi:hypothetical protein
VQRDEIGPSNPRPILVLDRMTDGSIAVGKDRKARFTLSGSVTDALADVLEEDAGDIKTVKIFFNDQEIATAAACRSANCRTTAPGWTSRSPP